MSPSFLLVTLYLQSLCFVQPMEEGARLTTNIMDNQWGAHATTPVQIFPGVISGGPPYEAPSHPLIGQAASDQHWLLTKPLKGPDGFIPSYAAVFNDYRDGVLYETVRQMRNNGLHVLDPSDLPPLIPIKGLGTNVAPSVPPTNFFPPGLSSHTSPHVQSLTGHHMQSYPASHTPGYFTHQLQGNSYHQVQANPDHQVQANPYHQLQADPYHLLQSNAYHKVQSPSTTSFDQTPPQLYPPVAGHPISNYPASPTPGYETHQLQSNAHHQAQTLASTSFEQPLPKYYRPLSKSLADQAKRQAASNTQRLRPTSSVSGHDESMTTNSQASVESTSTERDAYEAFVAKEHLIDPSGKGKLTYIPGQREMHRAGGSRQHIDSNIIRGAEMSAATAKKIKEKSSSRTMAKGASLYTQDPQILRSADEETSIDSTARARDMAQEKIAYNILVAEASFNKVHHLDNIKATAILPHGDGTASPKDNGIMKNEEKATPLDNTAHTQAQDQERSESKMIATEAASKPIKQLDTTKTTAITPQKDDTAYSKNPKIIKGEKSIERTTRTQPKEKPSPKIIPGEDSLKAEQLEAIRVAGTAAKKYNTAYSKYPDTLKSWEGETSRDTTAGAYAKEQEQIAPNVLAAEASKEAKQLDAPKIGKVSPKKDNTEDWQDWKNMLKIGSIDVDLREKDADAAETVSKTAVTSSQENVVKDTKSKSANEAPENPILNMESDNVDTKLDLTRDSALEKLENGNQPSRQGIQISPNKQEANTLQVGEKSTASNSPSAPLKTNPKEADPKRSLTKDPALSKALNGIQSIRQTVPNFSNKQQTSLRQPLVSVKDTTSPIPAPQAPLSKLTPKGDDPKLALTTNIALAKEATEGQSNGRIVQILSNKQRTHSPPMDSTNPTSSSAPQNLLLKKKPKAIDPKLAPKIDVSLEKAAGESQFSRQSIKILSNRESYYSPIAQPVRQPPVSIKNTLSQKLEQNNIPNKDGWIPVGYKKNNNIGNNADTSSQSTRLSTPDQGFRNLENSKKATKLGESITPKLIVTTPNEKPAVGIETDQEILTKSADTKKDLLNDPGESKDKAPESSNSNVDEVSKNTETARDIPNPILSPAKITKKSKKKKPVKKKSEDFLTMPETLDDLPLSDEGIIREKRYHIMKSNIKRILKADDLTPFLNIDFNLKVDGEFLPRATALGHRNELSHALSVAAKDVAAEISDRAGLPEGERRMRALEIQREQELVILRLNELKKELTERVDTYLKLSGVDQEWNVFYDTTAKEVNQLNNLMMKMDEEDEKQVGQILSQTVFGLNHDKMEVSALLNERGGPRYFQKDDLEDLMHKGLPVADLYHFEDILELSSPLKAWDKYKDGDLHSLADRLWKVMGSPSQEDARRRFKGDWQESPIRMLIMTRPKLLELFEDRLRYFGRADAVENEIDVWRWWSHEPKAELSDIKMTPTEMIIRAHLGIPIEDLAAMKRLFKLMKNVKGGRAQDSSHILHWPMLVNDPVPMSSQLKKFTRFYEFFGLKVVVSPKALKKLKLKS